MISTPRNNHPRPACAPALAQCRGNAFIIILVAVVLFAALSFSVSRTMRSGSVSGTSSQSTSLIVSDLLDYANALENAVDRVRRNGCSEGDISFENGIAAGYEPAVSVADNCKIFNPAGGGVNYRRPPENAASTAEWIFAANRVGTADSATNMGSGEQELVLLLEGAGKNVCDAINTRVKAPTRWQSKGVPNTSIKFIGAFDAASDGINRDNDWPVPRSGCFCVGGAGACDDASVSYFYHVLLIR